MSSYIFFARSRLLVVRLHNSFEINRKRFVRGKMCVEKSVWAFADLCEHEKSFCIPKHITRCMSALLVRRRRYETCGKDESIQAAILHSHYANLCAWKTWTGHRNIIIAVALKHPNDVSGVLRSYFWNWKRFKNMKSRSSLEMKEEKRLSVRERIWENSAKGKTRARHGKELDDPKTNREEKISERARHDLLCISNEF